MRVLVISAFPTVRAGLRALAQEQPGWTVVGETSPDVLTASMEHAVGRVGPERRDAEWPTAGPDQGLATNAPSEESGGMVGRRGGQEWPGPVDVALAELDGPVAAGTMRDLVLASQPRLGLVIIGAATGTAELREALAAAPDGGARGSLGLAALPREATGDEIVAAVLAAAGGLVALDREFARALIEEAVPASGGASPRAGGLSPQGGAGAGEALTAREVEVLQLVAEGLPNKLIAGRLHISEHTAKFHVASIMLKLGAASRTEAVTLAARRGLLIL